jgi:hypothetical protein
VPRCDFLKSGAWFHTLVVVGASLAGGSGCGTTRSTGASSTETDGQTLPDGGSAQEASDSGASETATDGAVTGDGTGEAEGGSNAIPDAAVDIPFPHITAVP